MLLGLWAGLAVEPCRHRVLPNGEVSLMLHPGKPQRLVERDGARSDQLLRIGFIAGLQERPATFESFAPFTRVVTARLTPLGAWILLGGLPQTELVHRVLGIDEVLEARAGIAELDERMLYTSDLGAALDLLEQWLLERWRNAPTPHPATQAASALLAGAQAGLPVARVAREAGVSPRRLRELFLDEVGVGPKRLARIQRFRLTLERLARARTVDLTRIALECGYYDQPHLYRDFRELAQMTPVDYLAAIGDATDGADVIGG
jgi:AraC-like DNA-binding protein